MTKQYHEPYSYHHFQEKSLAMINWYVQLREKVFILGWFTFLIGFLSFDVNVTDFDIDQCNEDASEEVGRTPGTRHNQISSFSETHKCHRETSQVEIQ